MADLSEIIQSFQMLNQGVQSLALNRAMQDAKSQVDQIRSSELSDAKKNEQLRNLANDFTMRLTGQGQSPQAIQNAHSAIAPVTAANPEAGVMSGDPYMMQLGQQQLDKQFSQKKELVSIASGIKAQKDAQKDLTKKQDSFNKVYNAANESMNSVRTLRDIITNDPNNKLTGAAVMAKLPRVFGEKGKLSDSERKLFAGSSGAEDKFYQMLDTLKDSQLTPDNKKQVLNLLDDVEGSTKKGLVDMGALYANQLSTNPAFASHDPNHLAAMVTSGKIDPKLITSQQNFLKPAPQGPMANGYQMPGQSSVTQKIIGNATPGMGYDPSNDPDITWKK